MADKEIFLTNDKTRGMSRQLFSNSSPASQSTNSQSAQSMNGSSAYGDERAREKLTTEEEVFLMNIDYFEQWDRV